MTNIHEQLMERFPKLGLLSLPWDTQDATSEELALPFELGKIDALYVYGLGGSAPYFQIRGWLHADQERRLIFLEDEASAIASLCNDVRSIDLLQDPQVHIALITPGEVDALARQFPFHQVEVVALPSREGARFRALRLQLLRKTTLAHALHLDRLCGYQPLHNFLQNVRHLPHSFYANHLHNQFRGVPAIVCGAGPSLNEAIPLLKELQDKALLIAGGSTITALSAHGIIPHFGMAIDPNLEEYRRLRNSYAFHMPLLYSTRVFPAIFQTCDGPFGYMRSGIGGVPELFLEEALGLLGPHIGADLSSESLSVTPICAAWAHFLGCSPILFCGVDLAYTHNKRYADGVVSNQASIPFHARTAADRIVRRKNQKGTSVHTAIRWVMESASLSHFAKKNRTTPFFNTSLEGLPIKGVPYLSLREATGRYLTASLNLRPRVAQAIAQAPMPLNTQAILHTRLQELKESLARVIHHLEVLTGKLPGSKPLAEVELEEEAAMSCLFYDIEQIFPDEKTRWDKFLELARKYQVVTTLL